MTQPLNRLLVGDRIKVDLRDHGLEILPCFGPNPIFDSTLKRLRPEIVPSELDAHYVPSRHAAAKPPEDRYLSWVMARGLPNEKAGEIWLNDHERPWSLLTGSDR